MAVAGSAPGDYSVVLPEHLTPEGAWTVRRCVSVGDKTDCAHVARASASGCGALVHGLHVAEAGGCDAADMAAQTDPWSGKHAPKERVRRRSC